MINDHGPDAFKIIPDWFQKMWSSPREGEPGHSTHRQRQVLGSNPPFGACPAR
jgi:hypothetical protein